MGTAANPYSTEMLSHLIEHILGVPDDEKTFPNDYRLKDDFES